MVATIVSGSFKLILWILAAAGFARLRGLVFLQFLAHPGAVGLAPAALQVVQHAFERFAGFVFAHAIVELDGDLGVGGRETIAGEAVPDLLPDEEYGRGARVGNGFFRNQNLR